jgi:tRNA pseudouridine32 synthase/23S rRNA pseudouridine746 synthase/23S rRNA pseudouridine1911/1915/1917 synthase
MPQRDRSAADRKFRRIRGVRILHEDPDIIVVEKAAGILTCSTRRGDEYTVEDALNDYVRKGQPRSRKQVYLVHRLDRETSGVMMVAKTPDVQEYFRSDWNELTEKTYLARVRGTLDEKEGVFESYLAEDRKTLLMRSVKNPKYGKFARTLYRVLSEGKGTTLVEVQLKSGRKNQIRVHFSEHGHPIVGDSRYGRDRGDLMLHSWKLAFVHPHTGKKMYFETDRPPFAVEKGKVSGSDAADESKIKGKVKNEK